MGEPRTGAPIGPLLDALGVRIRLDDGQQLVEAMVIGKVVDFRIERRIATSMIIGTSDGLDWIDQRGLLAAGTDILLADIMRGADE